MSCMPRTPTDMARAFGATMELFETGVELMRQNLRRRHPEATDREIDAQLHRWLGERPGAEHGDAPGRVVRLPDTR